MFAFQEQEVNATETSQYSFLEKITLGNILECVAIVFIAWFLVRLTSRLFTLLSEKIPRARFLAKLLAPVTRIGLWFLAIFAVVSILAPSGETWIASIGSMALALGLGAQDLIKNVIGGLVVLIDRPYQLGDRVKIGEAYGEIDHIGLRSTKLTTPEDTRVTIPNAIILTNQVSNANSGVPDCQVVTDMYLPIDTDPDLASRIGYEAAYTCPLFTPRCSNTTSGCFPTV